MDIIAHGLWAAIVGKLARLKTAWWLIALMSMGPDFVWLPFTTLTFLQTGHLVYYAFPYEISHSLVIWGVVTLLATIRWRWAIAVMWPWALHILIDIPGHIHIQTPFLWPLSPYTIRGRWEWLDMDWMIGNYFAIVLAAIFLWWRERRRKRHTL
jgi:hypothetical protein